MISRNRESIIIRFIIYFEISIFCIIPGSGSIFHINSKSPCTIICQSVNSIISKPVFIFYISKSSFIGTPILIKILTSVFSSLKYRPSTTIRCHIAICLKWFISCNSIWIYGIDSIWWIWTISFYFLTRLIVASSCSDIIFMSRESDIIIIAIWWCSCPGSPHGISKMGVWIYITEARKCIRYTIPIKHVCIIVLAIGCYITACAIDYVGISEGFLNTSEHIY